MQKLEEAGKPKFRADSLTYLEEARAGKSHFRADNLTYPLRQKIFKFIQGQDPADQCLKGLILHELPKAEPNWDLTLSGFLPFLLRPPQPNSAQGAAPAPQAQDAASRQRVGSRVDASTGQQARYFSGYTANKLLPISAAENEPGHIHFVTAPCKDSGGRQIGTYRGFVCVLRQVGLVATGSRFPTRRPEQQTPAHAKGGALRPQPHLLTYPACCHVCCHTVMAYPACCHVPCAGRAASRKP